MGLNQNVMPQYMEEKERIKRITDEIRAICEREKVTLADFESIEYAIKYDFEQHIPYQKRTANTNN